jgi:hypothetical protein
MVVKLTKEEGITKMDSAIVSDCQIRTFNQSNDPFFRNTLRINKKTSGIVRHQMKTVFLSLLILFSLSPAFGQKDQSNAAFTFGEELQFEVTYGWLDLAEAKLQISKRVILENSRPHYKIDAYGKTKGAATIFGRVNDNWGTHIDTSTLLPALSYRYIEEGKYRKNEKVHFDQQNKKAKLELFDRDNRTLKESKEYDLPSQVQDLVSGFYYLRSMDLTNLRKGQSITITGFFDKEIYNLKLIYEGTELLETRLGSFETYIFSPQIPQNKLFRGEFPVKVWVTKDQNKIPVKIKASLFIGSLNVDIASAKGLRNN